MTRDEFNTAIDEYLEKVALAMTGCGEPPATPDLSFVPVTPEDRKVVEDAMERCAKQFEKIQDEKHRLSDVLKAPRLERNDSPTTGRTLFASA